MKNGGPGLFDNKQPDDSIPRLNKCFLCGSWALEKNLKTILVPDQAGHIEKPACRKCLSAILREEDKEVETG